jgi:uncharacterized protein (TIGR03083 family)
MDEQMTKARLLETLRARRAEWNTLLAEVPPERMTEPGVAGEWSVKDIVAHLLFYERWLADRLHERLRGEAYAGSETDYMPFDEVNERVYQQNRHRSAEDVLAESRDVFQRLVAGLEAQPEEFLIQPQHFEGAPQPVVIWQLLRANVYDHYGQHAPSIRNWLDSSAG